jgi:hypothetical protein
VAIDTCASCSGGVHRMPRATGFHPLCVCGAGAEDIVAWGVDGDGDRGSEGRSRGCSDGRREAFAYRGKCGADWVAAASSVVRCSMCLHHDSGARREPPFGGGKALRRCCTQRERRRDCHGGGPPLRPLRQRRGRAGGAVPAAAGVLASQAGCAAPAPRWTHAAWAWSGSRTTADTNTGATSQGTAICHLQVLVRPPLLLRRSTSRAGVAAADAAAAMHWGQSSASRQWRLRGRAPRTPALLIRATAAAIFYKFDQGRLLLPR